MAIMPDQNTKESTQAPESNIGIAPETTVETDQEVVEMPETQPEVQEQPQESEPVEPMEISEAPTAPPPAAQVTQKDPDLVQVENILAEDLTDVFLGMPDEKKPAFKQKGEEVAQKIQVMITSGKVKVKRVLDLIREWLSMIPGVNKFFLEQESKIKTDRILAYAEQRRTAS